MKKAVDLSNLLTQAGSIAIEKEGFDQKLLFICALTTVSLLK